MSQRIARVNQLVKEELSKIILKELEFPVGSLVTITRVESSANLQQTRVYISCLPEQDISKVLSILNQNIYELQQELNRRLRMRPVPRISFIKEKETLRAEEVEKILEKLKKR